MTTIVRVTLADLESDITSRGYGISVHDKYDGRTIVTLARSLSNVVTRKFEGEATRNSQFPYETALKIANRKMRQFEDRFGQ